MTAQARAALIDSSDAAFVMQVPSSLIIAASPSVSGLLDPQGADVVGRSLEDFTSNEPSGALSLFAEGKVNGYESVRTLTREGSKDLRVSLWHRRFDHQAVSDFALVLITTGSQGSVSTDEMAMEIPPVVGAVSRALMIDQISSGAADMFGISAGRMLGLPVSALVEPADAAKWHLATSNAAAGTHLVTVVVRPRWGGEHPPESSETCEVLLLPLRPGFTFIFSSTERGALRRVDSGVVRTMLLNLSRLARLAEAERQRTSGLKEQDLPGLSQLTARERDMLTRLISGYRVGTIAQDLVLSPSTVRSHLASVFAKLGVSNQSELLNAVRSSRPALGWSEFDPARGGR